MSQVNTVESITNEKMQSVIKLIGEIIRKVPDNMALKKCDYSGVELLNHGTEGIKTASNFGVLITTSSLKPFVKYFKEHSNNGTIGLYTHSNKREKNNGVGICKYEDADFAEINVVTDEKEISLCINYLEPKQRKIGHYVKVVNK